jgi:hypothetical protein
MGMEHFSQKGHDEGNGRLPIDKLAKEGHYKDADLPGFDTYDVGITDKGVVLDTSSGGVYDEKKGPSDSVIRASDQGEKLAKQSGLNIIDELPLDDDETKDDAAAKWLRENDPNHRKDLN